MNRRPTLPGDWLADAAIVVMAGIALAHGWAALGHFAEVAEHTEMGMAGEAAVEARIGWLLVASVAAGFLLAIWGIAVRRRRTTMAAWTVTVLVVYGAMIAAGIASRTSFGLLGHADDAGPLWAVTVAAEIAVFALTAAFAASVKAAEIGVKIGGSATGNVPAPEPTFTLASTFRTDPARR